MIGWEGRRTEEHSDDMAIISKLTLIFVRVAVKLDVIKNMVTNENLERMFVLLRDKSEQVKINALEAIKEYTFAKDEPDAENKMKNQIIKFAGIDDGLKLWILWKSNGKRGKLNRKNILCSKRC